MRYVCIKALGLALYLFPDKGSQNALINRACYGMENGMERKENFGMEYGRCSLWNGMEDLKNGMEDRLPY